VTRVGTTLLDGIRVIGDITFDEGEAIALGAAKNGKP
jgi:hypothetical protein